MSILTREECENLIHRELKKINRIYKLYNPEGKYLSMAIYDDCMWVINARHEEDAKKPIDRTKFLRGGRWSD